MKAPKYNSSWPQQVKALHKHDMEQYWDKSLSVHQWNQYQSQLDIYLSLADDEVPLKILDVGCAQATLAMLFAERGHSVTAVDIRQESLDYAASRYEYGDIEFLCGNALEMEINQQYDLIFANQIVEHLVYPEQLVSGLKSLLSANGRLIVTTPNWHYFVNKLPSFIELGDPKQWQHKQFTADGEDHFYAYKDTELLTIFEQSGFEKIGSTVHETPFISGHLKLRYLHKLLPYSVLSYLDRLILKFPILRKRLSHQLMVVGKL